MNKTKLVRDLSLVLIITLLLLNAVPVNASSAPSVEWQNTYGGVSGNSIVQSADGGFVLAVTFNGNSTADGVLKINAKGDALWNATTNEPAVSNNFVFDVSNGGYVVAQKSSTNSYAGSLVKVDSEGKMQWNQSYQPGIQTYMNYAVQTQDGGYALIGGVEMSGKTIDPTWILKTDANGNLQWNKTLIENFTGSLITQIPNGSYVFAGDSGGVDPWLFTTHLAKTDQAGNILWEKAYENQLGYRPRYLLGTSDGGFMLVGAQYLQDGSASAFALKTDSLGNLVWNKTYGENSGFRVALSADEGFIFAGGVYDSSQHYFARLIRTDAVGTVDWQTSYSGKGNSYVYSLIQTGDNGYALTGATGELNSSNTEIWVVKLSLSREGFVLDALLWVIVAMVLGVVLAAVVLLVYRRKK